MDKHSDHETFDVIVSESALLKGYFGVYGISNDQPNVQLYLLGGFENVDGAIEAANSLIHRWRNEGTPISFPEDYKVEYRKREDFLLEESYPFLEKDNLVESVSTHINKWFVKLNKRTLLKGLLSYGNIIFYGTILVIWIYGTGRTFTVPDLDLPIVGKSLSGKVLNRGLLATYYPLERVINFKSVFPRRSLTSE